MGMSLKRIYVLQFKKGRTLCRVNAATQGEVMRKHRKFDSMGYELIKVWRENAVA